jgi:hypothetical protein
MVGFSIVNGHKQIREVVVGMGYVNMLSLKHFSVSLLVSE